MAVANLLSVAREGCYERFPGKAKAIARRDGETDRLVVRKFRRGEKAFARNVGAFFRIGESGGDNLARDGRDALLRVRSGRHEGRSSRRLNHTIEDTASLYGLRPRECHVTDFLAVLLINAHVPLT